MNEDLGPWITGTTSKRGLGDPPHKGATELMAVRDAAGTVIAYQDWDGCRAAVKPKKHAPPPRSFPDDTPTHRDPFSVAAAEKAKGRAGTQSRKIYDIIKERGPIATWEIEEILHAQNPREGKHQTVSARITVLHNKYHLIKRVGHNVNREGNDCATYMIRLPGDPVPLVDSDPEGDDD